MTRIRRHVLSALAVVILLSPAAFAQQPAAGGKPPAAQAATGQVAVPADYVIGVEDLLGVVFWREQDKALTTDVVVRPDGKISIPMLNDIPAAGMTPEALAKVVQQAASKYILEPSATVVVREIKSRKVYVVGEVAKPGPVVLGNRMTVLQAIAEAGGPLEHADKGDIAILRNANGREERFKFNYKDALRGKKPEQNIQLMPGDTVLVH